MYSRYSEKWFLSWHPGSAVCAGDGNFSQANNLWVERQIKDKHTRFCFFNSNEMMIIIFLSEEMTAPRFACGNDAPSGCMLVTPCSRSSFSQYCFFFYPEIQNSFLIFAGLCFSLCFFFFKEALILKAWARDVCEQSKETCWHAGYVLTCSSPVIICGTENS